MAQTQRKTSTRTGIKLCQWPAGERTPRLGYIRTHARHGQTTPKQNTSVPRLQDGPQQHYP